MNISRKWVIMGLLPLTGLVVAMMPSARSGIVEKVDWLMKQFSSEGESEGRVVSLEKTRPPIGSILAWQDRIIDEKENTVKVLKLEEGWARCDGTIVDDQNSPFYNSKLPLLNESKRFLRGANQAGSYQEQDWKTFSVKSIHVRSPNYTHQPVKTPKKGEAKLNPFSGKWNSDPGTALKFRWDEKSEIRPVNYGVVWIIRIK